MEVLVPVLVLFAPDVDPKTLSLLCAPCSVAVCTPGQGDDRTKVTVATTNLPGPFEIERGCKTWAVSPPSTSGKPTQAGTIYLGWCQDFSRTA